MSTTMIRRLVSSLLGHIVVFEIVWSLPLYLIFFVTNSDWTVAWAIYAAFLCAAAGAACGAFLWFVVTAPRLRRRKKVP
jgi:hypothetical protein